MSSIKDVSSQIKSLVVFCGGLAGVYSHGSLKTKDAISDGNIYMPGSRPAKSYRTLGTPQRGTMTCCFGIHFKT